MSEYEKLSLRVLMQLTAGVGHLVASQSPAGHERSMQLGEAFVRWLDQTNALSADVARAVTAPATP